MICSKCGLNAEMELFVKRTWSKKDTGTCKKCKQKSDQIWYQKNKEKKHIYDRERWINNAEVREKNRISVSIMRFGLDADKYVSNKKCEMCGIDNKNHIKRYGQRLNINHRNNKGRMAMRQGYKPDNRPENLQVLCRSCHCTYGNKNEQNYSGRGHKIWETRKIIKNGKQEKPANEKKKAS